MAVPYARFFRNAPVMEMLDFLERLAPFSAPGPVAARPAAGLRQVADGRRQACCLKPVEAGGNPVTGWSVRVQAVHPFVSVSLVRGAAAVAAG
jgi:hypothetical protein